MCYHSWCYDGNELFSRTKFIEILLLILKMLSTCFLEASPAQNSVQKPTSKQNTTFAWKPGRKGLKTPALNPCLRGWEISVREEGVGVEAGVRDKNTFLRFCVKLLDFLLLQLTHWHMLIFSVSLIFHELQAL